MCVAAWVCELIATYYLGVMRLQGERWEKEENSDGTFGRGEVRGWLGGPFLLRPRKEHDGSPRPLTNQTRDSDQHKPRTRRILTRSGRLFLRPSDTYVFSLASARRTKCSSKGQSERRPTSRRLTRQPVRPSVIKSQPRVTVSAVVRYTVRAIMELHTSIRTYIHTDTYS
ncbi:hypothetical protein LY76DRAFT_197034 [Colletotrichum caudatum]|nr:hypothetical protein LY76DRAFT_197034 [Colletotrichum caudatum]